MALDEARLRNEQRRLADELEQRVANRTKELAAADRQLQLQVELLQLIPVAAWTLRPDGTTDFVNQNWLEYTGQSLEYVISEAGAWMAMVHPDDREIASTSFWKGIGDGKDFAMETRIRRARRCLSLAFKSSDRATRFGRENYQVCRHLHRHPGFEAGRGSPSRGRAEFTFDT